MPNSVHELERRRADIVQKIAGLGDLRPDRLQQHKENAESRHAIVGSRTTRATGRTGRLNL